MKHILQLLAYKVMHPQADIRVKHPKHLSSKYHITEVWYAKPFIFISIEA